MGQIHFFFKNDHSVEEHHSESECSSSKIAPVSMLTFFYSFNFKSSCTPFYSILILLFPKIGKHQGDDMYNQLEEIRKAKEEWLKNKNQHSRDLPFKFVTASSEPVELLATPADLPDFDYLRDLNFPGEFPYTRGIHYNMYRGKLWTMRQFAGLAPRRIPISGLNICWKMGRRDSPWHLTCRPSWGAIPMIPSARVKLANVGFPLLP